MKKVLLLGAGRSATVLIDYLIGLSEELNYQITIADQSVAHIEAKIKSFGNVSAHMLDIKDQEKLTAFITGADLVLSLLPAAFHAIPAAICLQEQKHFVTASYVSAEIKAMQEQCQQQKLTFLLECGLDPGLDHMSAMQLINSLKAEGAELTSFTSFTGGLIAPESDTNAWHYKITWNPRNVVLAGQGTAKYLEDGKIKYIPYQQLFKRTSKLTVADAGNFEGYANRDSLSYIPLYGLEGIPTMLRGTLRRPGYCKTWDILVQLGLTDDTYQLITDGSMTYRGFLESFLPAGKVKVEKKLATILGIKPEGKKMKRLEELGLFSNEKIELQNPTPAQIIEQLMVKNLALKEGDKDMIVMQHVVEYIRKSKKGRITSSLVVTGEDPVRTAMAKTVGLPMGIAARLILEGNIKQHGVLLPTLPEIYEPVLEALQRYGITFTEDK